MAVERITDDEGYRRGIETYQLDDGRRINFSERDVHLYGLPTLLRRAGVDVDEKKRLPVFQGGEMVGTLPELFDPKFTKSRTFLYDPRPGDFVRKGSRWIASTQLGQGDLDAVPEFRRA